MTDTKAAQQVFEAIHEALAATEKTREPMNALILWTELGKGFAGKLERQGADVGLLERLAEGYCRKAGADEVVDLARVAYRVEPELRMSSDEAADALGRVTRGIEQRLTAEWGDLGADDKVRDTFLAAVRGWFPVGLDIMRSMPAFRAGDERAVHSALCAWCARYLPKDASGPKELGVRVEKG